MKATVRNRTRDTGGGDPAAVLFSFAGLVLLAFGPAVPSASAESTPPVPESVAEDDYSHLRSSSPFRRVLDPAENYVLRGVASLDNFPVATVLDRKTNKTIVVTPDTPTKEGLKLIEIQPGRDLEGLTALLSFGEEEIELKYEQSQLSPQGSGEKGKGDRRDGQDGDKKRGPSQQDIERWKSLTDEQRNRLRTYIGHVMRNYQDLSREEKGNMIRGAMMRLSDGRDLEIPQSNGQAPAGQPSRPDGGGGRPGGGR